MRPTSGFSPGFTTGFALPFVGLRLALAVPALRRWSAAMVGATALALAVLLVLLVRHVPGLTEAIWSRPEGAWQIAWWGLAAVLFTLGLVLGLATVPALVTSPLADPLVAATEKHLGIPAPEGGGLGRMAAESARSVAKTALRILLLLAGHALLLPLWLVPGAGHLAWTVLSLAWTVFWLVFEYLDLPANRYGYRFGDVARGIRANPAPAAGFGVAVYLLLWVPVLNTLFIPAATVGATLLFRDLRAAGRLPR